MAELATRIMAGDRSSEAELYQRFNRGVHLILRRMLGGPITEDIAQETFRIALQKIREGKLREPEKLPAFIAGITRKLAIDYIKRSKAAIYEEIQEAEHLVDPSPDQLDQILQHEKAQIIRRVLGELRSERDREVLFRYYFYEEDKEWICADLGLTLHQFNLILFRARQRLRVLYQKALKEP